MGFKPEDAAMMTEDDDSAIADGRAMRALPIMEDDEEEQYR